MRKTEDDMNGAVRSASPDGSQRRWSDYDEYDDVTGEGDAEAAPLSREDVQRLGLDVSDDLLYRQLRWQLLAGVAAVVFVWLLLGNRQTIFAAAYGVGCSFVPTAFSVFVVQLQGRSDRGGGLLHFFVYEAARLLLSLGMLVAGAYYFGSSADKAALLCMVLVYVVVLKLGWVQAVISVLSRRL